MESVRRLPVYAASAERLRRRAAELDARFVDAGGRALVGA
jgi:hypothetical protein